MSRQNRSLFNAEVIDQITLASRRNLLLLEKRQQISRGCHCNSPCLRLQVVDHLFKNALTGHLLWFSHSWSRCCQPLHSKSDRLHLRTSLVRTTSGLWNKLWMICYTIPAILLGQYCVALQGPCSAITNELWGVLLCTQVDKFSFLISIFILRWIFSRRLDLCRRILMGNSSVFGFSISLKYSCKHLSG